ncbi:BadF/BadG/BcrA/BcrD ATPase family protein [Flavobacterium columnare]|uniref:BadF/BadG/BcrA/BcrD ATPase family protein n=2 Tax=Flavobacterium TaxID=237 RepID=A0A2N9PD68_9FLAO|nr:MULTISPECIES: N-acetylglucosamine kinase [Flavobacterium]QYS89233.1 N-acetylglucosamine kinase [Flavobacterium davisii]RVU90402.1 N-acetylglucosamine kinase [Flavobacterium columnare]SPE78288.1 BadF/BadG/BcrA/BcrD ATPase family protein [Flavobacterium columnare]
MKLIIDSGSTKADWIAIDDLGNILFSTHTLGLNPEILTEIEVLKRLNDNSELNKNKENISNLYFYGAGCGTDRMKNFLVSIFEQYFLNAKIIVYEDTYAAVYATTLKGEKAIVSILGTGSNCSYFDGDILHQKVQSLGYIIMDDCSGNRFGRHLLREYYYNKMPKKLAETFEASYNLDADVIKQNLYKEPNPNAYLASFTEFLIKHKNESFCQQIINEEIESFIENSIKQFDNYKEVSNHFIGSVAYFLQDEIKSALEKHNIKIGKILQRPIDGLITYHLQTN